MRQRRVVNEAPPAPELEKRKQSAANEKLHICVPLSLIAVRLLSALVNTVHDCDEVFNFWEPLHFLLHGYGLQTWENRRVHMEVAHANAK
jgi:alpha-1,2-mannosyltransferase